uniref:Uncharacterized protein n=1 Tax=Glossina palpalis gambiensis TaxID=67801 RepID=A0A1B0AZW9_9MUSC
MDDNDDNDDDDNKKEGVIKYCSNLLKSFIFHINLNAKFTIPTSMFAAASAKTVDKRATRRMDTLIVSASRQTEIHAFMPGIKKRKRIRIKFLV